MEQGTATFPQTADGMCVVDIHGRVVFWNDAARRLLGYWPWEVVGKPCCEVVRGQAPDGSQFCRPDCSVRQAVQQGHLVESYDLLASRSDGRRLLVNVSVLTAMGAAGAPQFVIHTLRPRAASPRTDPEPFIRVFTFGKLEVHRQGVPVGPREWRREKTRALFEYLVAHHNQWVRLELLADMYWPAMPAASSLQNLRVALSTIRKLLEPQRPGRAPSRFLAVDGDHVRFSGGDGCWLDVEEFEAGLDRGTAMPPGESGWAEVESLLVAVRLYRGDYLERNTHNDWAEPERYRLRSRYLMALARLADFYRARGEADRAIHWRRSLVEEEPWDERSHQELMRDLAMGGYRTQALRQYHRCRAILAKELGAEPEEATEELYRNVLAGRPLRQDPA